MTMRPTPTPTDRAPSAIVSVAYALVLIAGVYLSVDAWTAPTFALWQSILGPLLLGIFAGRAVQR